MANGYYIGTDLKFKINISAEGFNMATDNFNIKIRSGNSLINVPNENIVPDGEGGYYLLINTSQLKVGLLQLIIIAEVPDNDFPTGIRHEVERINLCTIKQV